VRPFGLSLPLTQAVPQGRAGGTHPRHRAAESFNVYTTDLGEEGVDLGKLKRG
jgi:hypothetical protein